MKEAIIWCLVGASGYLQVPKLDFLHKFLPEFITWGESLSGFMANLYSAIGVMFLIAAFVSKLLSIKEKSLTNRTIELENELKEKELEDKPD